MMMKDVKHWKKLVHAGILSAAYTCEDGLKKSVSLTRVENWTSKHQILEDSAFEICCLKEWKVVSMSRPMFVDEMMQTKDDR